MNAPQMPQTLPERQYLFLGQPLSPQHHSLDATSFRRRHIRELDPRIPPLVI